MTPGPAQIPAGCAHTALRPGKPCPRPPPSRRAQNATRDLGLRVITAETGATRHRLREEQPENVIFDAVPGKLADAGGPPHHRGVPLPGHVLLETLRVRGRLTWRRSGISAGHCARGNHGTPSALAAKA
jgi:hypothetical protein